MPTKRIVRVKRLRPIIQKNNTQSEKIQEDVLPNFPELDFATEELPPQIERGLVHDTIKNAVYATGRLAKRGSRKVGELISHVASKTLQYESVSNMLGIVGQVYQGTIFGGEIAFEYLFSLHPNIIGPVVSIAMSAALGYMCGGFVGNLIYPDFWESKKIWQIITLGTNVSLLGTGTGVVAGVIGGYKFASITGEAADFIFQSGSFAEGTWLQWLVHKLCLSMIGAIVVALVIGGSPTSAMVAFQSLSSYLPQIPNLGLFGFLQLCMNLNSIKNQLTIGDYRGAIQTAAMYIVMQKIGGWIGLVFAANDVPSILSKEHVEEVENVVEQIYSEASKEIPDAVASNYEGIAKWLVTLLNRLWNIMTGPIGLICASILSGAFLCLWLWRRRKLNLAQNQKLPLAITYPDQATKIESKQKVIPLPLDRPWQVTFQQQHNGDCIQFVVATLFLIKNITEYKFTGKDVGHDFTSANGQVVRAPLATLQNIPNDLICGILTDQIVKYRMEAAKDFLNPPSLQLIQKLEKTCRGLITDANNFVNTLTDGPELNNKIAVASQNVLTSIRSMSLVKNFANFDDAKKIIRLHNMADDMQM